jgi:hypothetical protein
MRFFVERFPQFFDPQLVFQLDGGRSGERV